MKAKILVVDDNRDNLYLLNALLKGSGYKVESAADGNEALEKLRSDRFDVIVADILMPGMDGFQLCKECKRDAKLRNIPFIFCTATYTDDQDENLALTLGAAKYIRKPIEPDEFIGILRGILEGKKEDRMPPKAEEPDSGSREQALRLYNERLVKKLESKMLDLETSRKALEQKNAALREILAQIEAEKAQIQKQISRNADKLIMPILRRMGKNATRLEKKQLDLLERNIRSLTSEFGAKISTDTINLTPRQVEICDMIRSGMETKEIAEALSVSLRTVETHRNRIRKKLGISQKSLHLAVYLRTLE